MMRDCGHRGFKPALINSVYYVYVIFLTGFLAPVFLFRFEFVWFWLVWFLVNFLGQNMIDKYLELGTNQFFITIYVFTSMCLR